MEARTSRSRSVAMMLMARRYARPPGVPPGWHTSGTGLVRSGERLLVEREADRAADRRDDPEAQDDLRLRPRLELEVMVDRRHQEDALAEHLEGEDLDEDGERLDHEDAAHEDEQHLGLGHHGERRDRAAQPERPRVPHEDRRGEGVEPEEADARADEARRDEREIGLARGE